MSFDPKASTRFNDIGHAHALTFSCFHQQQLFVSNDACALFVDTLNRARSRHSFDIWAYVIMPEHVHLLICPRSEDYSISKILFSVKRPASYRIRKAGISCGPKFWQPGGGYDRNLWSPEVIHAEIDYIHANPVRRGLCESPEDWTYSSAAYWAEVREAPLKMDHTCPPRQ